MGSWGSEIQTRFVRGASELGCQMKGTICLKTTNRTKNKKAGSPFAPGGCEMREDAKKTEKGWMRKTKETKKSRKEDPKPEGENSPSGSKELEKTLGAEWNL